MTNELAHDYMENEIRCVQRASKGICTRDCNKCDLVREDKLLLEAYELAVLALEKQIAKIPQIGEWILCKDEMPEEHDTMFAKFKGTEKWHEAMAEKISDDVNVTVEYSDGCRVCKTLHTQDGEWNKGNPIKDFNVIAWQPLPDTYKD